MQLASIYSDKEYKWLPDCPILQWLGPLGHISNAQAQAPIDLNHLRSQGWWLFWGTWRCLHPAWQADQAIKWSQPSTIIIKWTNTSSTECASQKDSDNDQPLLRQGISMTQLALITDQILHLNSNNRRATQPNLRIM